MTWFIFIALSFVFHDKNLPFEQERVAFLRSAVFRQGWGERTERENEQYSVFILKWNTCLLHVQPALHSHSLTSLVCKCKQAAPLQAACVLYPTFSIHRLNSLHDFKHIHASLSLLRSIVVLFVFGLLLNLVATLSPHVYRLVCTFVWPCVNVNPRRYTSQMEGVAWLFDLTPAASVSSPQK